MKTITLFILTSLISTESFSSGHSNFDDFSSRLEGYWADDYRDTFLEIKSHRRGIKVRRNGRKWRTYNDMGRGVFDDCRGNVLIALGRGEIEYRRKGRRPVILFREGWSGRRNSNRLPRWERDDRRRSDYWYGRTGRGGFDRQSYRGDWYCADTGVSININFFNDRLGARIGRGEWTYYNPAGRNTFIDRRGNRYVFENNGVTWVSRSGLRRHRFRRR